MEAFVTKREQDDMAIAIELCTKGIITTPGPPFQTSQNREIDGLIARGVFEFV
jgi:hypothetical protein